MLCDECKKNQATIRLVTVVDGNKTERNLCAACVARKKMQIRSEGVPSMLSAIISGAGRTTVRHPGLSCPACGTEYDEFQKTNRLGCAHCYEAFSAQLKPLLIRLNGRVQHVGRTPKKVGAPPSAMNRMDRMRREMELAVACEEFEKAAVLRDEIRALVAESQGEETHG